MSITTSFKMSKKLAESGFEKFHDYIFLWSESKFSPTRFTRHPEIEDNNLIQLISRGFYPAYDFETLINNIPKSGLYFEFGLQGKRFLIKSCEITILQQDDESLTDCIARLWLLLKEKGIIKND